MSNSTVSTGMVDHAVLFFVCAVADANSLVCRRAADSDINTAIARADLSYCVVNIVLFNAAHSGIDLVHLLPAATRVEASQSTLRYIHEVRDENAVTPATHVGTVT